MRTEEAGLVWSLVVPVKPLARAKSRLAQAAGDGLRPGLALAFAQDTVAAALACPGVRDVVVVTDDPLTGAELTALGARVVPDAPPAGLPGTPGGLTAGARPGVPTGADPGESGLNAALEHGARVIRQERPQAAVAALGADLPALRPAELDRVLAAASAFPRAFLADAAGIGTTFLAAAPGALLAPAFGGASRVRHRDSGAREIVLEGVGSVRRDVDTGEDLRAALALGVGPHTARLCASGPFGPPAASGLEDSTRCSGA